MYFLKVMIFLVMDDNKYILGEYQCMRKLLNKVFGYIETRCQKHCTRIQYEGKRTFLFQPKNGTRQFWWNYKYPDEITVEEEYLIYGTQRTEGGLNLNFQAHPYGVAF